MPSYADEDDVADYENEMPDFQDEAEFDDYLNDEEYDLMNDIFPKAKKELEDYQGWTNLSVKLALFDSDFNLQEAMTELKKSLKKKKQIKAQAAVPKEIAKNNKMRLGTSQGAMSKLEQLARKKAAERSLIASTGSKNKLDSDETRGEASLLSKLRKGSSGLGDTQQKTSLADRLKACNKNKLDSFVSTDVNPTDNINTTSNSLHSRLLSLGRKNASKKSTSQGREKPSEKAKNEKTSNNTASEQVSSAFWDYVRSTRSTGATSYRDTQPKDEIPDIISTVVKPADENILCKETQKRKFEEIFTVFYPRKLRNTNKCIDAQKIATTNFQKPSPDDIVLDAQSKVFNQVNEKISTLKISLGKQPTDGSCDDDEADDLVKDDDVPRKAYKKVTVPTKPTDPIDVKEYLAKVKPHCSFVVLGHVDAGKSTLMGRLLYDVGAVDHNQIRKLKRESERIGKGSFHLAWVMDQTQEERERGVTVSICTSDFDTEKTRFTVVDAPGHRDFVPNAIAGISQADVALLCVDCGTDAFESGFNLDGQTKEHTLLARSMGVSQILVAMNKMDTIDWYSGRFDQIKNELSNFFHDVGFKDDQVTWIPCSGLSGEGVCKVPYPENLEWYKGPNLINALEATANKVTRSYESDVIGSPLLFSILEVLSTGKNEEAIISGRVESGSIQPGETITLYPSEQSVLVNKILTGNEKKSVAIATKGDFATLKVRHAHPEDIETGDLAASVDYPVPAMNEFSAQLLTFKMDRPLLPGTSFMLFRGVCQQPARVAKLLSVVDKQDTSKVLKKKVRHLGSNQAAIVEIELVERKRWLPILQFKENKRIGRVVLRKDGRTIAAGAVL